MSNIFPFLCVLLLVEGVSGNKRIKVTVTVIEGDSVTLKPDDGEIQKDETILWTFNGSIITSEAVLKRFGDRLNDQNGSLTIKNIRSTDSGLYKLNIDKSTEEIIREYSVTVSDVKSVSVMEGDSVTLHTGVTDKQRDDQTLHPVWKFKEEVIPIPSLNGPDDESWSNIHLNKETGDLTISNIRRDQTGDYKLEINTSSMILNRKLNITVSGEMKTVSVREGEPIILYTGLYEKQGHDLILWKFGDHLVAEINKETNRFLPHDSSDGGRFKGRLQLDRESGSLTVRGSRSTDSGVYHLDMGSSSYSLQRSISVTVSGLSPAAVALIVVVLLLLVFIVAVVIYYRRKISELERRMDVVRNGTNGTNDPLNTGSVDSDAS